VATNRIDLPQGTLDLLILKAVSLEPQHGWGIADRLRQLSRDMVQVGQGSLYPSLHRLERKGWIRSRWAVSENNRQAKYYELTALGRRQLATEADAWKQLAAMVSMVLKTS
jgi:transcriptional regulator